MRASTSPLRISSLVAFLSPAASPIFSTSNTRTPLASLLLAAISVSASTIASPAGTDAPYKAYFDRSLLLCRGAACCAPLRKTLTLGDSLDSTRTHSLLLERRQRQRHGPAHAAPTEDFSGRCPTHHRH